MKNMKQDLVTYLPEEIITEILARVPAQTILRWKCVCKLWHRLFETREFAKLHLSNVSKLTPGLTLTIKTKVTDKTIELTNVLDIHHHNLQDFHFSTITKLYFTHDAYIHGSIDGLLLLEMVKSNFSAPDLYLCNPITHEYIDLLHSHSQPLNPLEIGCIIYGFGVTKVTGQYKVVGIFYTQTSSKCKVYTIGTGSWRSIAPHVLVHYNLIHSGVFVNGNIHWLAQDLNATPCISCLDLETELFTIFSLPLRNDKTSIDGGIVVVVEGILCVCDYVCNEDTVTIWLMKEYGVEKSWTKEFVIKKNIDHRTILVYPIRVSKDGVILMAIHYKSLFYYSSKDKTIQRICKLRRREYMTSLSHTPSFLSLKYFVMENSVSF